MEIGTKMINLNWKYIVISAILHGSLFAFILYLFDLFSEEKTQTVNGLIFQGVFFGIFMGIGFPYVTKKFGKRVTSELGGNIKPDLLENEKIEIEGPANLFRGIESVGGKIFLTNKKVIFKSHKINIQKSQIEIEYENIDKIIKRKTVKLINNGIQISTKDGKEFDFVVNERDTWIEKLNKKILHYYNV